MILLLDILVTSNSGVVRDTMLVNTLICFPFDSLAIDS